MAAITQLGPDNRPMVRYGTLEIQFLPAIDLYKPQIKNLNESGQIKNLNESGQILWVQ